MDQTSQEYFDKIVAKDPDTLSQQEIDFLRARRSYLKKVQLEEYDKVLNPKAKPPVKETAKTHGTRK